MHVQLRLTCPVVLLTLLFAGPVFAHDPLNSSTVARLGPDGLEVRIRMAQEAARMLLEGQHVTGGDINEAMLATLRSRVRSYYRVSAGGAALVARKTQVELEEEDGIEFLLIYPRPPSGALRFEATFLKELPAGHRSSLSVLNEAGESLALALPTPVNPVVEGVFHTGPELPVTASQPRAERPSEPNAVSEPAPMKQQENPALAPAPAPSESASPIQDGAAQPAPTNDIPTPANSSVSKSTFWEFLKLGVEHILTGYDHLLFLCGLLIACRRFSTMAAIITCFTVAHSLTLALAALDLVSVSGRLVEPLIAASIGYVGIENMLRKEEPKGRWALTFAFGLIHGFGFAVVLRQMGLGMSASKASLVVPLFSFNLGVELGQIGVTAVVLPLLLYLGNRPGFARHGRLAISAVVALAGVFLFAQRVFFL